MTEERQNVLYQNLYWKRLTQFRFDLDYYQHYLSRNVRIIKWCNLAITGVPLAATCIWTTWGNNEIVKVICPLVFDCFLDLIDRYEPKYWVYSHVHLNYGHNIPRILKRNNTTIINAYERFDLNI